MSKLISVKGAQQVCPMYDGKSAHVGGSFDQGSTFLFVEGKGVLTTGASSQCRAGGPTTIQSGSSLVFIEGKPAATIGSQTSHGGQIVSPNQTLVFID